MALAERHVDLHADESLAEAQAVLLVHVGGVDELCAGCLDLGRLAIVPCWHARSAALVLGIDVSGSDGPPRGLGPG